MIDFKDILFLLVVFVSNVIQSITGFAGTVLAMPFSIMLEGYGVAKPILNVIGIVVSLGVVSINRKALNKKQFFKMIGVMLVGMAGGILFTHLFSVSAKLLYKALGIIVISFMILGCYHSFSKSYKEKEKKQKTSIWSFIVLIFAGIVHGMFVCGGPLLVVYASENIKKRDEFRVTISAVWAVLNTIILFTDIKAGYFNPKLFLLLGISIAVLFAAMFLGSVILKHINKKWFMIITYVLMGISGLSLILK
jgi:hypothetical protein